MIIIKGTVTSPRGFLASGVKAGIKKSGKKDLGILYSEAPCVAAAAFTTNAFKASPVKISQLHLKNKIHQAVIVNSGNANCANGKSGDRNARIMTEYAANALGLNKTEVLVASTGIIGHTLPIEKIRDAIPQLVAGISSEGGLDFSQAILTTDTRRKERTVKLELGKAIVTIAGTCKGVGMIYPQMKTQIHATALAFVTTDAAISKKMLERALSEAIEDSFNMVSVDGDMSTNDSCFILANALAGNKRIVSEGKDYNKFAKGLKFLLKELAKMIVSDGEGATKFIEIRVNGASSKSDAIKVARKISTSNLLKCCVFGEDPNWGRVVAAAGSSGARLDPDRVDVYLGGIKVLANGSVIKGYDKDKAKKLFEEKNIKIELDLKSGVYEATAWTCDLSKQYVAINSEYST